MPDRRDDPFGVATTAEERAHLIADPPARHAGAEFGDRARALESQIWRGAGRGIVMPLPLQQIGPIHGGGSNLHHDLALGGHRVRNVAQL